MAFHDFFRLDLLGLGEMEFCTSLAQNQLGTLLLPHALSQALLEVARNTDWVVVPFPPLPGVDFESYKAILFGIFREIEFQSSLVKRGMIAGT